MTLSAPEYIASEPTQKVVVFAAAKEQADSFSNNIAQMYVAALGPGGVGKKGCEAYPDPDLFTEEGVKATLQAQERLIAVAQYNEQICGAMVADKLSPYHVEFNSMAVRLDKRGLGIGSAIVAGLKEMMDDTELTINTTELVTHSLASQAAHFQAGYNSIVGFAFCHYPRVFFANHPESVLWVSRFQGKLIAPIKQIRSALGRKLGTVKSDIVQKVVAAQAQSQGKLATQRLSEEQLQLAAELLLERTAYVPLAYGNIVQSILFQFEDVLDRSVLSHCSNSNYTKAESQPDSKAVSDHLIVEEKDGFGHAYIIYKPGFSFDSTTDKSAIDKAIASLKTLEKRYILVRIPANQPEAIALADHLRQEKGFVFHSYLPLYGFQQQQQEQFHDILTLQWIAPEILASNALPGETDSVVKIYGYPENLSGPIIKLIASELNKKEQKHE
ncbi:GNAT family N-acetyltransferase [bacterium]|nr:GNAT family N-acetyltransferase [bacterium]MBP9807517.1 GNAT family N-acetyltransferase [bacterium]